MEKKRQKKWTMVKIILIMAFLFSVAGTNVASADGPMGDAAYNAAIANIYQGWSQNSSAVALLYGSSTDLYYAYEYMYWARYYMDEAWYYAGYYETTYGYYAYQYSDTAYSYYYDAEDYAYAAYYDGDTTTNLLWAFYYGGLGSVDGVVAEYYAAIDSEGGVY